MNRILRFTFRNGDVRMGELPAGKTLQQMWNLFKIDGAVIGGAWCAQFDHVAMIEVVEMTDAENVSPLNAQAQHRPIDDDSVKRLAVLAGAGIFKPPGEA